MKEITIKMNYEDATIIAFANYLKGPMNARPITELDAALALIKVALNDIIIAKTKQFLASQANTLVKPQVDASIADAKAKLTIE